MEKRVGDMVDDGRTSGCPMDADREVASCPVDLDSAVSMPFPWSRGRFDPPIQYSLLRDQQPVVRVRMPNGQPVWLVTRFDDVRKILSDPRVSADETQPGFPGLGPRKGVFSKMDDPRHAELRGLINKNFIVKRVKAMRPAIQELVDRAIDEILADTTGQVDLVPTLALKVPATILADLLGVPEDNRDHFIEQISAMLDNADPNDTEAPERSQRIAEEVYEYITELFDRELARDTPRDDVLGQLAVAHRQGEITRAEAISTGFLVITAGFDTTANAAALGILTLLMHPLEFEKLQNNPALLNGAIEELLRWLSHVHLVIVRTALEDIEIGGVTIPAGEGIMPLNFSANRDESHYEDPDEFKIDRHARDHVAFGYGVHQCQGQSLARLELNVIFETLFRRIPTLRLAVPEHDIELKLTARIHGVKALPVTW